MQVVQLDVINVSWTQTASSYASQPAAPTATSTHLTDSVWVSNNCISYLPNEVCFVKSRRPRDKHRIICRYKM